MEARIVPYVNLPGRAREALEFYASVLGGTPVTTSFAEFGMADAPADSIMHGELDTPAGLRIFAADEMEPAGDRVLAVPGSVSLALFGDDLAQLQAWWDGLVDGGTVTVPFEMAPWGDTYGQLIDRFGVEWMVNASDPAGE